MRFRRGFLEAGVATPSGLVGVEPWVDEARLRAVEIRSPSGFDGVDAPADPHGSARLDLVAHGVGQDLGGVDAVDHVAVLVEAGVELRQGEGAVAAQDSQRCGSEGPTGDGPGVGLDRGQRRAAYRRGTTALVVRDDWPQPVTDGVGLNQVGHPSGGELVDRRLDAPDGVEEAVPLHLQLDPLGQGEAGPPPVQPQAPAGDGEARFLVGTLSCRHRCRRRAAFGVRSSVAEGRERVFTTAHGSSSSAEKPAQGAAGSAAAADRHQSEDRWSTSVSPAPLTTKREHRRPTERSVSTSAIGGLVRARLR